MALTASKMTALGTPAPSFDLPDTDGGRVALADHAGRPLLVMFICNHCPFVVHIRDALAALGRAYAGRLAIVAINANDPETHPADSPAAMKIERERVGYPFPYLFDATQEVARAYGAACTPDFFLYDADHRLAYRGRFDDSTPGNRKPVTGAELRAAIDAVLAGEAPAADQTPSMGCNIKWRS